MNRHPTLHPIEAKGHVGAGAGVTTGAALTTASLGELGGVVVASVTVPGVVGVRHGTTVIPVAQINKVASAPRLNTALANPGLQAGGAAEARGSDE